MTTPAPTVPPAETLAPVASVALELVTAGLERPLFVGHAGDGSGRLFVLEQEGRIQVIRDGRLLPEPYLDLSDRISSGGERGLLGLAFSRDFARDGLLYVNYTDREGDTVVSELTAPDPAADRADPASERVLLRIEQPYPNHNGGALVMDPHGMLWIATGDGGSAGDPLDAGQRLDTLLGKLLRIDPRPSADAPYTVPDDNPFVGRAGARGEIWAYGLRNPWRFSFDRMTGDLWIGDVGQGDWEEIDVLRAGWSGLPNFGWDVWEGRARFEDKPLGPGRLVQPVAVYSHALGCSVTGGLVYRGKAVPALAGRYLYGDYCSGTIWSLAAKGKAAPRREPVSVANLVSFGEDAAGELYAVSHGGTVYRVAR